MIYFIENVDSGHIKIGTTSQMAQSRMRTMQTGNPSMLVLLGTMDGDEDKEIELHAKFHDHHCRGEWFCRHFDIYKYISDNALITEEPPYAACTPWLLVIFRLWPSVPEETVLRIMDIVNAWNLTHDEKAVLSMMNAQMKDQERP